MELKAKTGNSGFTVMELLVVIAILGILLAMLLPAIQASREASRQATCRDHLRQVSIALQSRMDAQDSDKLRSGRGLPDLLEYLEHGELASVPPTELRGVHEFLCPSDSQSSIEGAAFNYVFNGGNRISQSKMNGIIKGDYHTFVKLTDVRDGTSQTAALSERLYSLTLQQLGYSFASIEADAKRYTWYLSAPIPVDGSEADFIDACGERRATPRSVPLHLAPPLGFHFSPYSHLLSPNTVGCYNSSPINPEFGNSVHGVTATSLHAGGVNLAFCDGHIQFVADSIDLEVWKAIGSRSDHDGVGAAAP